MLAPYNLLFLLNKAAQSIQFEDYYCPNFLILMPPGQCTVVTIYCSGISCPAFFLFKFKHCILHLMQVYGSLMDLNIHLH